MVKSTYATTEPLAMARAMTWAMAWVMAWT
jgi:hypothetical protein